VARTPALGSSEQEHAVLPSLFHRNGTLSHVKASPFYILLLPLETHEILKPTIPGNIIDYYLTRALVSLNSHVLKDTSLAKTNELNIKSKPRLVSGR